MWGITCAVIWLSLQPASGQMTLTQGRLNVLNIIVPVALAVVLLSAPVLATEESEAEWLFVHTADRVEFEDGDKLDVPMQREIFAFTDRPKRAHRYLNAHEFVALWEGNKDDFEDDPPNAVLTWVKNGQTHEAEIELVDAAVANNGRSIIYQIDSDVIMPAPGSARRASLFVDYLPGFEMPPVFFR